MLRSKSRDQLETLRPVRRHDPGSSVQSWCPNRIHIPQIDLLRIYFTTLSSYLARLLVRCGKSNSQEIDTRWICHCMRDKREISILGLQRKRGQLLSLENNSTVASSEDEQLSTHNLGDHTAFSGMLCKCSDSWCHEIAKSLKTRRQRERWSSK